MLRIRKDDQVKVISGKNKGKTGKVIRVLPAEERAIVENINVVKKAVRKSDKYPQGGFIETERSVHLSNLMLVDKKSSKAVRFGVKVLNDGSKVRVSKESGEAF